MCTLTVNQILDIPRIGFDVVARVVDNTDALNNVMKLVITSLEMAALHLEQPVLKPLVQTLQGASRIVVIRNWIGGASDLMSGKVGCKEPFSQENPNLIAIASVFSLCVSNFTNALSWLIEQKIVMPEEIKGNIINFLKNLGCDELAKIAAEVGTTPVFRGISLKDVQVLTALGGILLDSMDAVREIHENGPSLESGMRIASNVMRASGVILSGSRIHALVVLGGIAMMIGSGIALYRFIQKEYKI